MSVHDSSDRMSEEDLLAELRKWQEQKEIFEKSLERSDRAWEHWLITAQAPFDPYCRVKWCKKKALEEGSTDWKRWQAEWEVWMQRSEQRHFEEREWTVRAIAAATAKVESLEIAIAELREQEQEEIEEDRPRSHYRASRYRHRWMIPKRRK